MTLGAKILAVSAVLCLLLWGVFLALGVQPLKKATALQVIYGEGEDFFADASVLKKFRNDTLFLLHLPRARPAYRWWTVDFKNLAITISGPPRSLGPLKFTLTNDWSGSTLGDRNKAEDWYWHFTDSGAAFSGNGFTCRVRRTAK